MGEVIEVLGTLMVWGCGGFSFSPLMVRFSLRDYPVSQSGRSYVCISFYFFSKLFNQETIEII